MEYIQKSALIAKIEKLKMDIGNIFNEYDEGFWEGRATAFDDVICSLATLEVKDMDGKKEIDYEDYIRFFKEHPDYNDGSWGFEETWTFAQYCYELGLKAQKGE